MKLRRLLLALIYTTLAAVGEPPVAVPRLNVRFLVADLHRQPEPMRSQQ